MLATSGSLPTRRRGMTMVEVLVVIAIIGLLMALALPAIQMARTAARRTNCQANLRQIGVALHGYHESNGCFPYGGPHVRVLPYLEMAQLYDRFNQRVSLLDEANTTAVRTRVSLYQCPVDPEAGKLWCTSYNGNYGRGVNWFGYDGFFSLDGAVRAGDVSDGLAATVAFSEILLANEQRDRLRVLWYTPTRMDGPNDLEPFARLCENIDAMAVGPPNRFDRGCPWAYGGPSAQLYNHILTPNKPSCNNGSGHPEGAHTAASLHSAGVHVLMGDGSVHFVAEHVDTPVWRALGSRAGNDDVRNGL